MDQLTWLQQSLQKPHLSAVARALAEVFPRSDVPRVQIDSANATRGTYNNASRKNDEHLEYPGFILRYREFNSVGNYVEYGWARPSTDHIGVLSGQVTVANDGFMGGAYILDNEWMSVRSQSFGSRIQFLSGYKQNDGAFREEFPSAFASLAPALSGLLTSDGGPLLADSGGTILLTEPLTWEEPLSRGFTSIQWLTESETARSK